MLHALAAILLATADIDLPRQAELRALVRVDCRECAWDVEGREAVVLRIAVDGRYAQHVPVMRRGASDYPVMLGSAAPGRHRVRVELDAAATARDLRSAKAATARLTLTPMFEESPDYLPLALAPFVYARPDTVGRFTDTPVLMWYESESTERGTRYRYSVIFTNEDGGTPADRLMATWGRTTDIEYIYSVEVDRGGRVVAEDYQGPEHKVLPFRGRREARHPLLWVATSNNMVRDAGTTAIRYAPLPQFADLRDASREVLMDANPWLYEVMAQELGREGKIGDNAPPGNGTIPDPRRFVYLEACGDVGNAALAFAAGTDVGRPFRGAPPADATAKAVPYEWISSDRGLAQYRIVRDGCFRAAIPLPADVTARDLRALRVQAFARPPAQGRPPAPPTPVRVTRINKMFMLDEHFVPGTSILQWTGSETLQPGGAPLELSLPRQRTP